MGKHMFRFAGKKRSTGEGLNPKIALDAVHARVEHLREAADERVTRRECEAVADHGPDCGNEFHEATTYACLSVISRVESMVRHI